MIDRRTEIPTWAFINAQIIQDADRSGALAPSIKRIEDAYHVPRGSLRIINSAYAVSLLYCLVVVPKELWLRNELPSNRTALNPALFLRLVSITLPSRQFDRDPVLGVLRHLRNALSHVRFEIGDNGDFTFWDQSSDNSARTFSATITRPNLEEFLSIVGAALANLRGAA